MSQLEKLLRHDRVLVVASIALLILLAVIYTVLGVGMNMSAIQMTEMRHMRDMPSMRTPGDWSAAYATIVFLMWWVMMVAMMLPSAAPTVLLYSALLRRTNAEGNTPLAAATFTAGYLLAWAGFSAVIASLQWWLEERHIVSASMMTLTETWPGGLVLIAAGIYQFTPLKSACLHHCRTPADFLASRYRPGQTGALVMGLEHGAYCLGCCWFLMALLFVGGIMNLFWIVGLAAFVAVEKLAPWRGIDKIAGVVLISAGGWIVLS